MAHCKKCNGTGFLPHYAGIKGGVCFSCGGVQTKTPQELAAEREKAKKKNDLSDHFERVRQEYPKEIEKAKLFLEQLDMESEFETEKERLDFESYVKRRKQIILEKEKELMKAKRAIIKQ